MEIIFLVIVNIKCDTLNVIMCIYLLYVYMHGVSDCVYRTCKYASAQHLNMMLQDKWNYVLANLVFSFIMFSVYFKGNNVKKIVSLNMLFCISEGYKLVMHADILKLKLLMFYKKTKIDYPFKSKNCVTYVHIF